MSFGSFSFGSVAFAGGIAFAVVSDTSTTSSPPPEESTSRSVEMDHSVNLRFAPSSDHLVQLSRSIPTDNLVAPNTFPFDILVQL